MTERAITMAWAAALLLALPSTAAGQQVPDTNFRPMVSEAAFRPGSGPMVAIDEGHHNFHTRTERFAPFAGLLARDGFQLGSLSSPISAGSLEGVQILVIANPLDADNVTRWTLPTPSAYTAAEITALYDWVAGGGRLLLIADHMPFGGAAQALAARFGVQFVNGFVLDSAHTSGLIRFRRSDGSLMAVPARDGLPNVAIDSVTSFTGQGFRLEGPGIPLLRIPAGWQQFVPTEAWQFPAGTPQHPAAGLLQGALLVVGKGRLAVFGEAAMFTAQLAGPDRIPAGFNHPEAPQNAAFVLGVLHWLAEPAAP